MKKQTVMTHVRHCRHCCKPQWDYMCFFGCFSVFSPWLLNVQVLSLIMFLLLSLYQTTDQSMWAELSGENFRSLLTWESAPSLNRSGLKTCSALRLYFARSAPRSPALVQTSFLTKNTDMLISCHLQGKGSHWNLNSVIIYTQSPPGQCKVDEVS